MNSFKRKVRSIKDSITTEAFEALYNCKKEQRDGLILFFLEVSYSVKLDWLYSTLPEVKDSNIIERINF